ncbi:MAG: hypothetical protein K1Y36_16035 [Blastocatellia bacterium]|nr:hypothetical protein [Blastocatellia bacterium]
MNTPSTACFARLRVPKQAVCFWQEGTEFTPKQESENGLKSVQKKNVVMTTFPYLNVFSTSSSE